MPKKKHKPEEIVAKLRQAEGRQLRRPISFFVPKKRYMQSLPGSAYVTSIREVAPIYRCVSGGGDVCSDDCQYCACYRVEGLVTASDEGCTKRFDPAV
ncbi:MAG TPA: hypothetical protein VFC29_01565 [Candidatus Limnocylindrales bacterium]|nr:hypothetical protein [Candidatus Limnocylindrales bacterium]